MALILNIDTALDTAYISLAENKKGIRYAINETTKDHAAWMQPAIDKLIKESGFRIADLNAIGVSIGPGSYTGLRIGLSAAKGLCFALKIPLITINTLEIMAFAAINDIETHDPDLFSRNLFICPMIDARRMEVFTAVYDRNLHAVIPPTAMELKDDSFKDLLNNHRILFFGNGHEKLKRLVSHDHAIFSLLEFDVTYISGFINKKYNLSEFADLIYSEPEYIKEFYINTLNKTQ